MKRIFLAIGSMALIAMLGVSMMNTIGVDAQNTATPGTSNATSDGGASKTSSQEDWLTILAEKLGIDTGELQTAIEATKADLGLEGRMSGNRHDGSFRGSHRGSSRGHDTNDHQRDGLGACGVDVAQAASFLGISEDELKTELRSGTFLEVAANHGKTTDDVRAFLIEQATAAIDARLQAATDTSADAEVTEMPASATATP